MRPIDKTNTKKNYAPCLRLIVSTFFKENSLKLLIMNTHKFFYTIQETDLDFLGHVNNANYVKILEQARWELVTENNYSLKRIQELGQCPIILSTNIKYQKELKARDKITVETQAKSYEGKVGTLEQFIRINSTDEIACTALITYGLFDMKKRKLILPTEEWLTAITSS